MFGPGTPGAMIMAFLATIVILPLIYISIIKPELENVNVGKGRPLTDNELKILKQQIKVKNRIYIVAAMALGILNFLLILGLFFSLNFDLILCLLIFGVLFMAVIIHLMKDKRDLKTLVSQIDGEVHKLMTNLRTQGPVWDFKVGKYSFDYEDIPKEVQSKVEKFDTGDHISIEFSPRSKVIWSIKKLS